ncbi:DUF2797 domain-containing protein [Hahella sp. SMD15-11]|uniref:DUF2797 domain-containing protein n=1 Tax=Thermohahella caldifontis TaxID=3142973 RepID=A0AB39UXX8_9GAMM
MTGQGTLRKMHILPEEPCRYSLRIGEAEIPLNECLGHTVRLHFTGRIECVACGRPTKKSFAQGHCYQCFRSLAACDRCIMSPELCHFDKGTCREPEWAKNHCMTGHSVYLANSSGLKVGITRSTQIPTRWLDQGATQAIELLRVTQRFHAGLIEDRLRAILNDRTSWQAMLKGTAETLDLQAQRDRVLSWLETEGQDLPAWQKAGTPAAQFVYPVLEWPEKVRSINAEKTPVVEGTLLGMKGQYLILSGGVINIRKYSGYEATWTSV